VCSSHKRVLEAPVTYKSVDMSGDQTNEFDLDNFTFTPEVLDISNLGDEIHTIPEEPVVSPSNTNTPQAMTSIRLQDALVALW